MFKCMVARAFHDHVAAAADLFEKASSQTAEDSDEESLDADELKDIRLCEILADNLLGQTLIRV